MNEQTDDARELSPGQTDEIVRRMADVIEEQNEEVTEHVDPHWELFYDKDHDDAEQIVHLHADEKVPATVTVAPDGGTKAECTQCDASLDIAPATHERMRAKAIIG